MAVFRPRLRRDDGRDALRLAFRSHPLLHVDTESPVNNGQSIDMIVVFVLSK